MHSTNPVKKISNVIEIISHSVEYDDNGWEIKGFKEISTLIKTSNIKSITRQGKVKTSVYDENFSKNFIEYLVSEDLVASEYSKFYECYFFELFVIEEKNPIIFKLFNKKMAEDFYNNILQIISV